MSRCEVAGCDPKLAGQGWVRRPRLRHWGRRSCPRRDRRHHLVGYLRSSAGSSAPSREVAPVSSVGWSASSWGVLEVASAERFALSWEVPVVSSAARSPEALGAWSRVQPFGCSAPPRSRAGFSRPCCDRRRFHKPPNRSPPRRHLPTRLISLSCPSLPSSPTATSIRSGTAERFPTSSRRAPPVTSPVGWRQAHAGSLAATDPRPTSART